MNTNLINLIIRFLLEIVMLIVLALWGWRLFDGWEQYTAVVAFPVIAAALWGTFRIQNDPKPAPVEVPGMVRLLLEFILFGFAIWGLYSMAYIKLSYILAAIVILHYLVSYDRTWAMLRNKPYNGFVK